MKLSTCLFGGTLLAAGIASHAQAQFSFSNSYARTYAREYGYFNYDGDFFSGGGNFAISSYASSPYAGAYGAASANALQIRTSASVSGNGGFAFGFDIYSFFTVGQDVMATVDWDWTQSYGYLNIYDNTDFVSLYNNFGNSAGSTQVSLIAGHEYYLSGYSAVRFQGDASTFWEVNIPAPGSAGLLGLAGLVAMRRRR